MKYITRKEIADFAAHLAAEEKSPATIEKYTADVRRLFQWLAGRPVTAENLISWKQSLASEGLSPSTINAAICAFNSFAAFMGWNELKLRLLRVQKKMFRDASRDLSRAEYHRLIQASGSRSTALIIETIGATGMRVSELRYLTVQAAKAGKVKISLKGKIREIVIPRKLCTKLLAYARSAGIAGGSIFTGEGGAPLSRKLIWSRMKKAAQKAGIDSRKVFPHNLRHLFAVTYYSVTRNLTALASLMGHSSVETTRIYLLTPAESFRSQLESMRLME